MHEAEALRAHLADESAARRAAERARDQAVVDRDDALADLERVRVHRDLVEREAGTTRARLEQALQECLALRQRLSAIGMLAASADEVPTASEAPSQRQRQLTPESRRQPSPDRYLPPPHASQAPTPPYTRGTSHHSSSVLSSFPSSTHPSASAPSRSNTISPPTTPPESGIRSTVDMGPRSGGGNYAATAAFELRPTVGPAAPGFASSTGFPTSGYRRQRSASTEGEPPAKRQHAASATEWQQPQGHRVIRLPEDGRVLSQPSCSVGVAPQAHSPHPSLQPHSPHPNVQPPSPRPSVAHSSPLPSIPSTPEPDTKPTASSVSPPNSTKGSATTVKAPTKDLPSATAKVVTTATATVLLNAEGKRICGECRKKMRAAEKKNRIGSINPTVAKLSPLDDDELLELGSRPASRARGGAGRLGSSGSAPVGVKGAPARPTNVRRMSSASNAGMARIATLQGESDDLDDLLDDEDEEDGGEDELVDNDEFMAAVDAAESGVGAGGDAFSP
ncbi:uncharacterized protein SCHCODRAFT_02671517 [Schizophyllum commune H4-8]|uniref:Uncharacterized protein n=1 Tax=Schizophyllum commune (strain H4-8 / FGSC 9210) TaxID=578458 RepID=D8QF66_SCHCM|nr:uncharacterized protein SCHCODRAFT_02671517 [Schizophyllum commune H4-8]KAI5887512.1 hypothetical protein SCHCODRAFT_02671517 [Schizophyllum commune H4-8]